jgi:OFA family oxalate/formate antiporter-like MFS transporter
VAVIADRSRPWIVLTWLALISAGALVLSATGSLGLVLVGLTLVGTAYGATIAIFPFAVRARVGADAYPHVYGRIFTAWGMAGLAGPVTAGWLFDLNTSYRLPLILAALAALLAALATSQLHRQEADIPA